MELDEFVKRFQSEKTYQYRAFLILSDKKWHCRNCGFEGIPSKQLAGGGGIQGLERGTKTRPGMNIFSEDCYCEKCNIRDRWDRWDGTFKTATAPACISEKLMYRILAYYHYIDAIEGRERRAHELVIDHRFPMERYGALEEKNPDDMSEEEIQEKFQLLKKDFSGNHNLLKSRACERCKETGKRQPFLGIDYFYAGEENWHEEIPVEGEEAKNGCVGCGWYDVLTWKRKLNEELILRKKEEGDK